MNEPPAIEHGPTPPSRPGRFWGDVAIAVGLHALVVALAMLHPTWFGYPPDRKLVRINGDIEIYYRIAIHWYWRGIPYRDYPVEYPILALPSLFAPLIAGDRLANYRVCFVIEMMLFDLALASLVARHAWSRRGRAGSARALAWYSAFFLVLCPLVVTRFDLVPTLLAFLSTLLVMSGRSWTGGLAAGLGVLTKVVPGVVMVPLLAIPGAIRPKLRSLAAMVAAILVGGFAWWRIGPEGFAWSLRYHSERGLEIGSLPASAYLVANRLFDTWAVLHYDHGSVNVAGEGSSNMARLMPYLQVALLLLVAARARSATFADAPRLAAAALLAFIVAGKVLSPQYLIWLIPFMAVMDEPRADTERWLFLAVCLLTTATFPHLFPDLVKLKNGAIVVLVIRNLALAVLFVSLRNLPADRANPDFRRPPFS